MFANTQMGGTDTAFPDTCLSAASGMTTTVPYVNTASGSSGVNASTKIMIGCTPAHNVGTSVPSTQGSSSSDVGVSAGCGGGPSLHLLGANTVLVQGMPLTRMTSSTMQNSTNASGARLSPSQTKVLVLAP